MTGQPPVSIDEARGVETTSGRIIGCVPKPDGVRAFLGIPYAEPPAGQWRFRAPRPAHRRAETVDGTRFGPPAPQIIDDHAGSLTDFGRDLVNEDCLSLNIWTLGLTERRPVLVWIHGGGNTAGSSRRADFDGARLAARGVVVVTLNYRLGIFGFVDLSALGGADYQTSANNGLLDQLLALQWIKANIAAFGGDPANVTVFGNSAGASNISALLAIDRPELYFRRAILQSGSATLCKSLAVAQCASRRIFARSNIRSVSELLQKSPRELLAIQARGVADLSELEKDLAFQPTVDTALIKDLPLEAIRSGSARQIDLVLGTTLNELRLYQQYDPPLQHATLDDLPGVRGLPMGVKDRLWEGFRASRSLLTGAQIALDIGTDYWFRLPAIRMAEAQLPHNSKVFMYLFNWQASDPHWGAPHAIELPFVFGNFAQGRMARFIDLSNDATRAAAAHLNELVQQYWTSFASTGTPSATDGAAWPEYTLGARCTMVFDVASKVVSDPAGLERCLFDDVRLDNHMLLHETAGPD